MAFSKNTLERLLPARLKKRSRALLASEIALRNDTQVQTSPVDGIVIDAVDLTSGNTIPRVKTEGTGIKTVGTATATLAGTIAIDINGTTVYLMYSAAAAT